jgi:hypothetical protein
MINRRDLFVGGGAAAVAYMAGSFMPLIAQNAQNLGTPSVVQVGFRKQKLGDMEIIALNDGVARRPLGACLLYTSPSPRDH